MNTVGKRMWLLMSITLFLYVPHVAAWSDCGQGKGDPYGMRLPDKLHPTEGIYLDQLDDGETLRLGAFNIQIFGKSKATKPEVMEVLGKIIRTYDIVAIQEIRDKSQTALPALTDVVNANSSAPYDYIVSKRLGRTSSKEQYAYIYNNQIVELTGTPHTYPEPNGTDPFHREPYIASFRVLDGNFDATLIAIHTDPDEATEEINALDDVVRYAQSTHPDENDFIVMGDLNADCTYFDEDSNSTMHSRGYYWCISNSVDTTTKPTDCTYDRIILTNPAVSDFTGDAGVFRFDVEYTLNVSETTAVSDHYPVYAEFRCDRDADSDPSPEVVRAVIALRIAVGSREYDPEPDINGDGRVTSLDALMILQAAAV
ncbi:MAG: hypothetical protein C5S48_00645 [Candidatus Methanogaster sp.]|nr:MAG: hypothetical protein C5S48_00645 [ANME-2 cluster archaeon]